MNQIRIAFLLPLLLLASLAGASGGNKSPGQGPHTLAELAKNIQKLERTEVVVKATQIGACKSGCKMWIADPGYQEGDLHALVRAKDDAFKFDPQSTGKTATITGFAVAKLLDHCPNSDKDDDNKSGGDCESPVGKTDQGAGKVQEITFFATKVTYSKD